MDHLCDNQTDSTDVSAEDTVGGAVWSGSIHEDTSHGSSIGDHRDDDTMNDLESVNAECDKLKADIRIAKRKKWLKEKDMVIVPPVTNHTNVKVTLVKGNIISSHSQ